MNKDNLEKMSAEVKEAYKKVEKVKEELASNPKMVMGFLAISSALKDVLDMAEKKGKPVSAHDIFNMLLASMCRLEQDGLITLNFEQNDKKSNK